MRRLQQIWEEVKRGENIDVYLAVLAAVSLTLLDLVGITPHSAVASITIAVLGLLAVSMLGNRHRLEELQESFAQSKETRFVDEYPESLETDFLASEEAWLVGVTLNRTLRKFYPTVERKLRRGDRVRVLLVDPDGAACEIASNRLYVEPVVERTRGQILDTLRILQGLYRLAPDRLEVRTIQNPLAFGAIVMDPSSASGTLYWEHYAYRTTSSTMPKLVLRRHGPWYDFFREEIQLLWEDGNAWKFKEDTVYREEPSEQSEIL